MRENMKRVAKSPTTGKQVLGFALLGLLLSGATFALGINTGRRITQAGVVTCENNPLVASDQKTEALAQIQQKQQQQQQQQQQAQLETSLSFQEELLKPIPVAVAAPSPGAVVSAPALVAAAPKPAQESSASAEPSAQAAVARQGSLKKAFLELEHEGKEVSKKEVLKPVVALKEAQGVLKEWTLQISSHKGQEEAERVADALNGKGYVAYVVSAELGEKGTWHRVRIGPFASKQEAEMLADKLVGDMHMPSPLVVSLR
ncbi:MAG: SPOR domain-containing protein [Cystobacterineae bacterium]|nr:SPOR domain-containing protein [Cystobacterineae bacterium]